MNSVTMSVLPVPVAPDASTTESRKKPPSVISSSASLPLRSRASVDRCVRATTESGMTTMP